MATNSQYDNQHDIKYEKEFKPDTEYYDFDVKIKNVKQLHFLKRFIKSILESRKTIRLF